MLTIRRATLGIAIALVSPLAAQQGEWQRIAPGGQTRCATGAPYSFFVRPADPTRVLLFMFGGGACWNGNNCHAQPTFVSKIGDYDPADFSGVLDFANPENPLAGHTIVVAPYCTGDLHLGARDQVYTVTDSAGSVRSIPVLHRGQANAMAVLDWITAHVHSPAQIVVAGTSAGSFPTPFYADLLARRYPLSTVIAIGDGAGIHRLEGAGVPTENWGLPNALRTNPGWEDFPADWGNPDLVITASRSSPRLALYQIDQAWDQSQGSWAARLGQSTSDLPSVLRENQRRIAEAVPAFRTFTLGGMFHTVLSDPLFFAQGANGTRLRDWVADIVDGRHVENVQCRDCRRPELQFARTHLTLIDSTISLLSDTGRWDPTDDGRCVPESPALSLRCAFFVAGGAAPWAAPVYQELFYSALDRLGWSTPDPARPFNPIRVVNDRPGTTVNDLVSLLTAMRGRIQTALDR